MFVIMIDYNIVLLINLLLLIIYKTIMVLRMSKKQEYFIKKRDKYMFSLFSNIRKLL